MRSPYVASTLSYFSSVLHICAKSLHCIQMLPILCVLSDLVMPKSQQIDFPFQNITIIQVRVGGVVLHG